MSSSEEDTSSSSDEDTTTLSHMIDEDDEHDDFDDEDDNDLLLLHGGADTPYVLIGSHSNLFNKLDIHTYIYTYLPSMSSFTHSLRTFFYFWISHSLTSLQQMRHSYLCIHIFTLYL